MQKLLYLLLLLGLSGFKARAQQSLYGTVTDERGHSLPGASISAQPQNGRMVQSSSGSDGRFSLFLPVGRPIRVAVTFVGYQDTAFTLNLPLTAALLIRLQPANNQLKEVVVSTGYQELPKERTTGSFVQVDRSLLERSVSTSVIDRLKDVVPGLAFTPGTSSFRIRGQSTLFSNADPLVVVDGFPYNEPVSNLNPNDIESISVLKDAAAASIWGAKAGNGVVVITTKRGRFNQAAQVSFSGNIQVGDRPNLNDIPHMSSADYISLEKRLFSEGYYTAIENSTQRLPLSPVVELLIAQRDGKISAAAAQAQISQLSGQNIRADESRYLYRPSVNQQYAANLSGGSATQRYFFSAGADRNLDNARGNGFDRITLNGINTWTFADKKLEFTAGLNYIGTKTNRNNPGLLTWNRGNLIYPYASLVDANGNAQAITRDYRQSFLSGAQALGFLDWQYRPLDELNLADNTAKLNSARMTTTLKYRLPAGFQVQLSYQYDRGQTQGRNQQSADTYFTRNLINRYTQVSGTTLTRPIPLGGIVDLSNSTSVNHDLRAQLNYDYNLGAGHELTAIAGYEIQSLHVIGNGNRLYGYDAEHATTKPVDGVTLYSYYDNPASGTAIPLNQYETDATDHYLSYYANAAYTYDKRLVVSGSARTDQSNLFGVRANQKGVPLWSAGLAWNLSREDFYKVSWLPELKLRATYGYNGNINKTLSAFTTAGYFDGSGQGTGLPYAQIINPPNAGLRWERVQHINIGADFATQGNRLSGSLEFYWKKGLDLIGSTAYAPSTGITTFTGNTAQTRGKGIDLQINSRNLTGKFQWETNYFISYVADKVTNYDKSSTTTSYVQSGASGGYPLTGRPLYALYSYRWAGLDPETGDPQGYLNGAVSKNYSAIMAATSPQDLVYSGSATPTVFGALRNTLTYKNISLSANISYRLGYYFRKNSLRYGSDYGLSQQSGDFALRWQQPGDETKTNIPSLISAPNIARDDFYTYAEVLVQKGDHIRLQDVRAAYQYRKMQFYVYAANLGIIWRANKVGQDPDYPNNYPAPLTLAGGLRFTY